ncbi:hypothetical protein HDU82_000865, partial [Entophlyctis luteolus]
MLSLALAALCAPLVALAQTASSSVGDAVTVSVAVTNSGVTTDASLTAATASATAASSTASAVTTVTVAASTSSASFSVASGDVCTTSGGGYITIINPLANQTVNAGKNMTITWNIGGSDATFKAAAISFGVVDASNPNDALAISNSYIAQSVPVSAQQVSGPVPSVLTTGKPYAVRSEYHDGSTWRYCFSPTFTVVGSAAATTAASGGSATSVTGVKGTSGAKGASGVLAVGAAMAGALLI